jgi:NADPH-dependent 2,4-dienoyl-CoA reductase/sulfur reductase-like enzyme
MPDYTYLLIGGGIAADAAARGIRETGATGSIGLISTEAHPPYDRPPLSKGLWNDTPERDIWRDTHDLNVTLHLGRRVIAIDPAARTVTDQLGERYSYGKLLLATGGTPRRLSGSDEGVIYFRTLDDYRRLRKVTGARRKVAVIGAGYIGAEIAAALAGEGHEVQMAFLEDTLLGRLLPADLGQHLNAYFRERGVTLHPGRSVASVVQDAAGGSLLTFSDGETLAADVVIAGLGIIPATELARSAGLAVSDGIDVSEFLQTSDEHIYAAGDVASVPGAALGGRRRVEHEDNANMTGFQAGRAMAGAAEPFTYLPSFYSDLFDIGFEGVGRVDSRLETVSDWQEPFRKGAVYYLEGGRLQGALLWNSWGRLDRIRQLIEAQEQFSVENS